MSSRWVFPIIFLVASAAGLAGLAVPRVAAEPEPARSAGAEKDLAGVS